MIISKIDGGLGNQLFQYAYGSYLARRHGSSLRLDLSSYETAPPHGYLLDRFEIESEVAEPKLLDRVPRSATARFTHQLARCVGAGGFCRVKEKPFGFHPRYLDAPDDSCLQGYWQSERFFPGMRASLLRQFKLRERLSSASQRVYDQLHRCRSLALHIRRGDYLSNSEAAKIYAQLSPNYYRNAITRWCEAHAHAEVFIFSNDPAWCRQQFQLEVPTHFVDHNSAVAAHEDLMLMSQAEACAIANSTFSWWAAWLNERPGRTIFAPSHWFNPGTLDDSNVIPTAWQRLPSTTRSLAA